MTLGSGNGDDGDGGRCGGHGVSVAGGGFFFKWCAGGYEIAYSG